MVQNKKPTGGVSLHNIKRARFPPPMKSLVELPLGVALSLIANTRMITINLLVGLVPLPLFFHNDIHSIVKIILCSVENLAQLCLSCKSTASKTLKRNMCCHFAQTFLKCICTSHHCG